MSNVGAFNAEIREQPAALARLLERGQAAARSIAGAVRSFAPRFVVIAARGSSDNAARYAQYLFGVHNELTVALAAPSVLTHYAARPRMSDALVIGVSQSGKTPDVVAVIEEARRQGAVTVAVVNDVTSPLARAAAHCLPIHADEERAVAATKTYANQLLAMAMLSAALADDPRRWAELDALAGQAAACIGMNEHLESAAPAFRTEERYVVVGRGYNYATAFETALKMKETSYVMAEPYSTADFLHGPVAMLDARLPVLAIAPRTRVYDDLASLIERVRRRGAKLIAVSDSAEVLDAADAALPVPSGVPEWLSPLVAVIPGQLWAHALAVARGMQPDSPRGLSKVTETW